MLSKQEILKKIIHVGQLTAASRVLGLIREILTTQYLGANALSDVFIAAFSIPNALRKIFAEGALSAAFVPEITTLVKTGNTKRAGGLMTLSLVVFQGMVVMLCVSMMLYAPEVMKLRVPGFSEEQLQYGGQFLFILAPLIFFLSTSSLLAGALHAVNRFGIPAAGPIILNVAFISSLIACIWFNLSIKVLCFGIIAGGLLQLLLHVGAYVHANFSLNMWTSDDLQKMGSMLARFLFSTIAMSTVEIKLFIDSRFASFLAAGSLSLVYYAERFMGIPLGIFATSFATVLLPHISRVCKMQPKRLNFYLLETFKLVYWVSIPASIILGFLAKDIFITLFSSKKFDLEQAHQAGIILQVYSFGLFFYSINKILHNFFFSFHATWVPAVISILSAIANVGLNYLLMPWWGVSGLVMASNICIGFEMIAMLVILKSYFTVTLSSDRFLGFMYRTTLQSLLLLSIFMASMWSIKYLIVYLGVSSVQYLLLQSPLYWLWVGPLLAITAALFFITRTYYNISLYFIDR